MAGLQWIGLSAQTEALRQQKARQALAEFSTLLNRLDTAPTGEKPAVAEHLTGLAEQMSRQVKSETLASASRRVVALVGYEKGTQQREKEMQDRLRAEVRGLVNEAESLESAALARAAWLSGIIQALLISAAVLCGFMALRGRQAPAT